MRGEEIYMRKALQQAAYAFDADEVPVGAVMVRGGTVIASAYNQIERLHDPTAHAEILAITSACAFLREKWLLDCSLYVTLEPCAMCAGALVLARVKHVFFGAADGKTGACGSRIDINAAGLNHTLAYTGGVLADECGKIISDFFQQKRLKKNTVCGDGRPAQRAECS